MSKEVFPQLCIRISLNKESILLIRPGMFWLADNTFSDKLCKGLEVRAIVFSVERNRVLGWLPQEKSLTYYQGENYSEYKKQILHNDRHVKLLKRMPTVNDWVLTFPNYQLLSKTCEQVNYSDFSGSYWCWERSKPSFRYVPKTGEKAVCFKDGRAKVRWILEAQLK